MSSIKDIAKEVFKIEAEQISNLSKLVDESFENAINTILKTNGKLIICGMGKSGHIGKKIAATFASTGTPSFFLHPAEAYHGDLGMIEQEDIILLISNSGESDEILKLIPFFKSQGNTIISMSGNPKSTLASNSSYHLNIAIQKEACPLSLAPMSSTTATLVMGDAIAVALMKLKNFKDENFAKFHPGGSLGKRLLATVQSVMKQDNLPTCEYNLSIKDVIYKITEGKCGLVVVLDNGKIIGIITDGDIRRAMQNDEDNFFNLKASDLMSINPKSIKAEDKLVTAQEIMNNTKINSLVVVNQNQDLVGIVQMYDLGL